jgi:ribonucleoside-diphosphate reductase alpha chain
MGDDIYKKTPAKTNNGLNVERHFTKEGTNVFDLFKYDIRSSVIRNPAGDAVFEMNDVEVPASWSQVATDILAQKYFRKAGVPLSDGTTGSTAGRTGVCVTVISLRLKTRMCFMMK